MICPQCKGEIPATARFCPSCGAQTVGDADIKAPQEITLTWLESVYKSLDYNTEIKNDALTLKHDRKPNMTIYIKGNNQFLGVNSAWTIPKPPSHFGRKAFMEILNKANAQSFLINFSITSGNYSCVNTSSFMWTGTKTSARDVADFTDMYIQQINHLFESSGLLAFC
jgi:hypothetical protein